MCWLPITIIIVLNYVLKKTNKCVEKNRYILHLNRDDKIKATKQGRSLKPETILVNAWLSYIQPGNM